MRESPKLRSRVHQSKKNSSPKQQVSSVHGPNAYFTIITDMGTPKESSPITNVKMST